MVDRQPNVESFQLSECKTWYNPIRGGLPLYAGNPHLVPGSAGVDLRPLYYFSFCKWGRGHLIVGGTQAPQVFFLKSVYAAPSLIRPLFHTILSSCCESLVRVLESQQLCCVLKLYGMYIVKRSRVILVIRYVLVDNVLYNS